MRHRRRKREPPRRQHHEHAAHSSRLNARTPPATRTGESHEGACENGDPARIFHFPSVVCCDHWPGGHPDLSAIAAVIEEPGMILVNATKKTDVCDRCHFANSVFKRMVGLLNRKTLAKGD